MSARKLRAGDSRQTSFNFFISSAQPVAADSSNQPVLPSTDIDLTLRAQVSATLDEAAHRQVIPMDREQVAAAMSRTLGRRVSKAQLDQWSAPSQGDRRIHADALRALGLVTGDWRALHHLVEACGFRALTPKEALCAEFGAVHAVRRHLEQRARELAGGMEEMVPELVGKMRGEAV